MKRPVEWRYATSRDRFLARAYASFAYVFGAAVAVFAAALALLLWVLLASTLLIVLYEMGSL